MKKTEKKYYLAYGSNMNLFQMKGRCPDSEFIATTILKGVELRFQSPENHNSRRGVLNIIKRSNHEIPVTIFSVSENDEKRLDIYEGFPYLYVKKRIKITVNDQEYKCFVYVMNDSEHKLIDISPTITYYNTVLKGYADNNVNVLPLLEAYQKSIKGV